ncbi:MAG: hypothetical protein ABIJ09_13020 [Pseudomonadota bacterium]
MADPEQQDDTLAGLRVVRLAILHWWRRQLLRLQSTARRVRVRVVAYLVDSARPAWLRRWTRSLVPRTAAQDLAASAAARAAIAAFKNARAVTPPPRPRALGADHNVGKQRVLASDEKLQRQVAQGLAVEQVGFPKKKKTR